MGTTATTKKPAEFKFNIEIDKEDLSEFLGLRVLTLYKMAWNLSIDRRRTSAYQVYQHKAQKA